MASSPPAPRRTFHEALRSRSDEQLVALLLQRPDLATPSPSTLRSLAARATSRTSLDRVISRLNALDLQVLEAVLVLGEPSAGAPGVPTSPVMPSVTVDDVVAALGAGPADPSAGPAGEPATGTGFAGDSDEASVRASVARLEEMALLWWPVPTTTAKPTSATKAAATPSAPGLRAAPGLTEILGPYPAGLGPADPQAPSTPLAELLADAPPGAREILNALTWGPPVGVAPRADPRGRHATTWLIQRRLLLASDERHVVLPQGVGLALRGGRTHTHALTRPPEPDAQMFPVETIAAESARSAQEIVRLVALLLSVWHASPPNVLRSGGLGVRDLRRLAIALETEQPAAAFAAELALSAGLVVDDGEDPPSFVPTTVAEEWLDLDLTHRWAELASAWITSVRTPWLVGSRDERGSPRAALEPELSRPWVPRLRRDVLSVLAAQRHSGLSPQDVLTVLHWHAPRATPPAQAVTGLLQEAEMLGVTGVDALASAGRALLDDAPAGSGLADVAAALERTLPPEVAEILVQGDLTGIVPGRPAQQLAKLIEVAADVESRGAAITVRFTPDSLTRAFDAGMTADDLLTELGTFSRSPLPQPLEYVVRDTARKHGRVRVGTASSYVRSEDTALLTGLVEDPALRNLALFRLAPTVLVAHVPAAVVQAALRDRGLASTVEGPDGKVLRADNHQRQAPVPRTPRHPAAVTRLGVVQAGGAVQEEDTGARAARYADLVPQLRAGDQAATQRVIDAAAPGAGRRPGSSEPHDARRDRTPGTTEPTHALAILREAIESGSLVVLEVVGAHGLPTRRRVKPLTLDAGRLRALDPSRDAELTVAVHRIAGVFPDDVAPTTQNVTST